MITRPESGTGKLVPYILPINGLGHLERDLEVSTFDSKVESRLLILNKVKCNLGVSLLLEVSDDTLSDEVGSSDNLQYFVIVLSD